MPIKNKFGIVYKHSDGSIAQLGEHLPYKQGVTGSSPVVPTICGNGSVVERHLAKVNVASSNLVSRSIKALALRQALFFCSLSKCWGKEKGSLFAVSLVLQVSIGKISLWDMQTLGCSNLSYTPTFILEPFFCYINK